MGSDDRQGAILHGASRAAADIVAARQKLIAHRRRRALAAKRWLLDAPKVLDRRELLRVKLKSLAEEARIIRHEERKAWGPLLTELHEHRVHVVRKHARFAHIAYGLIKGRRFEEIEPITRGVRESDWLEHVAPMLKKYGPSCISLKRPAAAETVASWAPPAKVSRERPSARQAA